MKKNLKLILFISFVFFIIFFAVIYRDFYKNTKINLSNKQPIENIDLNKAKETAINYSKEFTSGNFTKTYSYFDSKSLKNVNFNENDFEHLYIDSEGNYNDFFPKKMEFKSISKINNNLAKASFIETNVSTLNNKPKTFISNTDIYVKCDSNKYTILYNGILDSMQLPRPYLVKDKLKIYLSNINYCVDSNEIVLACADGIERESKTKIQNIDISIETENGIIKKKVEVQEVPGDIILSTLSIPKDKGKIKKIIVSGFKCEDTLNGEPIILYK